MRAERELMEWKTAQFMESRLGEEYDALIISVQKFGFFVELVDIFVEGLVSIDRLEESTGQRCMFRERDHAIVTEPHRGTRGLRQRGEFSSWATACEFAPSASTRCGIAWNLRSSDTSKRFRLRVPALRAKAKARDTPLRMTRFRGGRMKPTIGFIGLGLMGKPMARNVLRAGFPLVVWNRTRAKADDLVREGAKLAANPREVASQADVLITIVSDPPALEEVLWGARGAKESTGALDGLRSGTIFDRFEHCIA